MSNTKDRTPRRAIVGPYTFVEHEEDRQYWAIPGRKQATSAQLIDFCKVKGYPMPKIEERGKTFEMV